MEHVRWSSRPRLRSPVVVSAFGGWNDAGDAASIAARYLNDTWAGRPFAEIDPEEFYDFSSTRPHVRLVDGRTRSIDWPHNTFAATTVPGTDHDVVILQGVEPQLRWRTFCQQIIDVAQACEARLLVTLGALLAEVPHSRPVAVFGTAGDEGLIHRHDLQRSRYEGPTGIVGVLNDACTRAGLPAVSLWAAVPAYVPSAPSPKAALALVERVGEMLDVTIPTTSLEIASAAYEREVDAVVADDEDMAPYVARLETLSDEGRLDDDDDDDADEDDVTLGGVPFGSPEELVEEVERFLRDQRDE